MKTFLNSIFITQLFLVLAFSERVLAQKTLQDIGVSGQFFLSYEYDFYEDYETNEFTVKRGYITFENDLSDKLGIRFTQDITIDQEGDGSGDIELRLKYALLNYAMDDIGILTSPNIEMGVVHRPWIDFEQNTNDFRVQKPMMLDQNEILASADFGLQFEAGIGNELRTDQQKGLKSNPAKYGSFSVGLYNGGGYSSLEMNNNKLFEARLSLRFFPRTIPGFQTSFLGAFGKGNIPESPDFQLIGSALTYESEKVNFVFQGFQSTGDSSGRFVHPDSGSPYRLKGWSAFSDVKLFNSPVHVTLRYDELYNRDLNHLSVQQWVAGLAYIFKNRSKILLDVSRENVNALLNSDGFTRFEVVTEVRF
ncbi:hypothetical protein [Rhodohalobacter sp. 614A]|uniref:hypothetical protein n=1 Tax=Rhodohalobacter sp. 614A TaxID=2908649 RepID=UPI001F29CC8A|nr:hypothetical protein [Rhodohalobacter sp. 614A]